MLFFKFNSLTLAIVVFISIGSYGQDRTDRPIPYQDSILLQNFWSQFETAIRTKDKVKLAALCQFPFYCRPCIARSSNTNKLATIKVTKKLFFESQYKEFFDKPVTKEVEKHKKFETYFFYPSSDDRNKDDGFKFSYTIIAPSKRGEGLQGFIYIEKIRGQYKIIGIDTVP